MPDSDRPTTTETEGVAKKSMQVTQDAPSRPLTPLLTDETRTRSHISPRAVLLIVSAVFLLLAFIAFWLWPRMGKKDEGVEKPPTVEGNKQADEHSQEGAIEVTEDTAKLIGIKIEEVVRGQIEETLPAIGKVLVAPNGQAVVGAKVDGRAVRVMAEPGQVVSAGQVLVIVDSPQIADLRGQLM